MAGTREGGGGGTYFAHKTQSSSPSSTSNCETTFLSIGVLLLQAGDRRARVNHTLIVVGGQSHTGNTLPQATSWCSLPVISFSMVCTERDTRLSTSSFCFSFSLKQSTVKQDCNPISINLESHTQKTSTPLVALPKKQPWIDNDLVKLSTADHTIIKSPTGWLSDSIIDAAQKTLQEQFGLPGFQSVLHGQCCNFNVEPDEFIQILHNGSNHWVTVSTIGTKHPEVFVYDSMYTKAPDRLQQQIAALLHTKEEAITLKFTKVNVQSNSNDSGVFAIAFATALCHGTSPAQLLFDESKMRHHLLKCLEQGCFTMFPVRQRSRMVTVKAVQYIPIHCTCRMPSIDGIDMIECTACKDWFHVHCASPSTSVLNCTDLPWHCDICLDRITHSHLCSL